MATGDRVDPYKTFNFLVEIDGIVQAGFTECTRLRLDDRGHRVPRGRREHDGAQAARARPSTPTSRSSGALTDSTRALRLAPQRRSTAAIERKNGSIVLLERSRRQRRCAGTSSTRGRASGTARRSTPRATTSPIETLTRRRANGSSARREDEDAMFQTEFEFTLPLGYLDQDGQPASRRRRCGWPRRPTRSCRSRIRACRANEAYLIVILLSRVVDAAGIAAADQAEGDRGPVRGRPGVSAGRSTTGSTARRAARRCDGCPQLRRTFERGAERRGGVVGYPLDPLYGEVAFVAYHFHWPPESILNLEHGERRRWVPEISAINERMNDG